MTEQNPNQTLETTSLTRRASVDEEGNPQAIIWAVIATKSFPNGWPGAGECLFLLDDFYFIPSVSLRKPWIPIEGWGGYPGYENSDVDTWDWLGWINIKQGPCLWSYLLKGWLYMEEPAEVAPGAWAYFYK